MSKTLHHVPKGQERLYAAAPMMLDVLKAIHKNQKSAAYLQAKKESA